MIFEYDNVVIGSSLSALTFAYLHQYPIFFTTPDRPFRFDYFESTVNLQCVGIPSSTQVLKTLSGFKDVGIPKYLLWERLAFLLSVEGLLPLADLCDKMRYNGEKIVCTNEYSKIYEFDFNTCYYFRDTNLSNLVSHKPIKANKYLCYDYIAFNRGGKHEIDYLSTDDDFVREIWFYSSDRIDGNTGVKDACIVSTLTEEQLLSDDHIEAMARFKMEAILKEHGIRGPYNGTSPTGRPKYYSFKTSHMRRIKSIVQHPEWTANTNIKKISQREQDLIHQLQQRNLNKYDILKCDYPSPA